MTPTKTLSCLFLLLSTLRAAGISDKPSLNSEGAHRIINAATTEARRLHTTGVIAVVDDGGNLLALEKLDGTFAAGANIAIGKARTAAIFQKPTKAFEETIASGRTAMITLADFTPLQGGVPVILNGKVVGAVGASGAASAQQDEELAMAGARGLVENPRIAFFSSTDVKTAFAKGTVLFDQGERYMVHASRRSQPGQAEIHTEDADIVYVLDGTATLVTGGTPSNVKPIASGELRGDRIDGGEVRNLTKGDVIIIPAGTPHWFEQTSDPFLYYVVKVR